MEVIRVRIELKRIQTYLFAVPRLRTILGANALIGETLRQRLPAAAKAAGACWPAGLRQPAGLTDWKCELVSALTDTEEPWRSWSADDPASSYIQGVLTRDGGHFQALFADDGHVKTFEAEAARIINTQLPGVLMVTQVDRWHMAPGSTSSTGVWQSLRSGGASSLQDLFEMPGQRVCEWTGQGPGSVELEISNEEAVHVSPFVKTQWDAGTRFMNGKSHDILGLLQRTKQKVGSDGLPCRGAHWSTPKDLSELAGGKGRYLALVHVDGNGVGKRTPQAATDEQVKSKPQSLQRWLDHEAKVEAFYASMRQQVRRALIDALNKTFADVTPGTTPYQLLMLGGDDLLLACRAELALPFVVQYAQALKSLELSDKMPLDVGAGVAIAQPTFPFHALHALAEELASSAKRLSRACVGHSVVDWMVVTNAAVPDPAEHRRQHDWSSYRIAKKAPCEWLTTQARPYFVLEDKSRSHSEEKPSLESLVAIANKLRGARASQRGDIARSQLKQLPRALRAGRRAGERAFDVLPGAIRASLKEHGITRPWTPVSAYKPQDNAWFSVLPDLIEISEIPDLGRRLGQIADTSTGHEKQPVVVQDPEAVA